MACRRKAETLSILTPLIFKEKIYSFDIKNWENVQFLINEFLEKRWWKNEKIFSNSSLQMLGKIFWKYMHNILLHAPIYLSVKMELQIVYSNTSCDN